MIAFTQLIPRIWADVLMEHMEQRLLLESQIMAEEQAKHEKRMAEDPAYARAYELRQAEREAESYWDALYEHWFPSEEDDDEW